MRVLLTGGAGFIGSHVAEGLLRKGHELTILDSLDSFYSPGWKRANLVEIKKAGTFEFFEGDICAGRAVQSVFEARDPEMVIHLAALGGVQQSVRNPDRYEMVNVHGTVTLLERCRLQGIKKFIFASSSSVYGMTALPPFHERWAPAPMSPYAATKVAGEAMCHAYASMYKIQSTVLRFFTVYGSRMRPDLAIHKFVRAIEEGRYLTLYGDPTKTARDYTHVSDVTEAVLAAMEWNYPSTQSAPYMVFNIGSGLPATLERLIYYLRLATGKEVNFEEPKERRIGDSPFTWASVDKAMQHLQWRPIIPLQLGLQKYVEWFRAHPERHNE